MSRLISTFILLCILFVPAATCYCLTYDDTVARIIREKLGNPPFSNGLYVGSCQISSLKVLPEVYRRREYLPVWTNADSVQNLMDAIQNSYQEGLDPNDYHINDINNLQKNIRSSISPDPSLTASLDILLTDAFIRLANHTNCGKEDPASSHPQWNLERKIDDIDPVEFIENALESQSLEQAINTWKINHPFYSRLKSALADYRALRDKGGWDKVPDGPALKKGMSDQRIPLLRKRLALTDNLTASPDPLVFDDALEHSVIQFQKRHGIKEDGVVGKKALEALNVPLEERIDQIRVNLERARWVLRNLDDSFVLVDIAGFRVFYQKNNKIVWSCKAQVGQPYRDTPVLKSKITHIEINPFWVVPPTIFEKDILPEVQKNPGYLKKKNIVALDSSGRPVNPRKIKWSLYPGQNFPYTLRQNPGKDNALGRIKIMFPNEYFVYLHDTPHKELFSQEDRTFSSGCIRIEKPFELAELLLADPLKWNLSSLMKVVSSSKTKTLYLPRTVTVLLLYWTVEVDEEGIVYFKKDPYNRDTKVLEGLGYDWEITTSIKNQ